MLLSFNYWRESEEFLGKRQYVQTTFKWDTPWDALTQGVLKSGFYSFSLFGSQNFVIQHAGRWGVGVMACVAHEFLSSSHSHGGHWGIGVGEEWSEHHRCSKLNPWGIRKGWRTEEWPADLLRDSGLFHVDGENMWCQGKLQHSNFIGTDVSTIDVPKKNQNLFEDTLATYLHTPQNFNSYSKIINDSEQGQIIYLLYPWSII